MKPAVLAVVFMVVFGHQVSSESRHRELGEAAREFALKLQQKLSGDKEDSIVLSPFSVHSSLSLARIGARNETAEVMEETLNYISISAEEVLETYGDIFAKLHLEHHVRVEAANAMFIRVNDQSIEQDFKNEAESKYEAKIDSFNASDSDPEKKINEFVSEKTDGEIKDILKRGTITELTSVLVVSALSFNGSWEHQFEESKTKKQEFTCENGNKTEVDMMNDTRIVFRKRDNETNADVVSILLKGKRHALYIALPSRAGKLDELVESLSKPGKLNELFEDLKPAKVELNIPKFKIYNRFDLKPSLVEMGMGMALSPGQANFEGISLLDDLFISEVIHSAQIEINEKGIRAAAATVVDFQISSFRPDGKEAEKKFCADHAFMYWVMDSTTKQTLFQGIYTGKQQ